MPDINRNLLIVDDEPKVLGSLKRQLRRDNFNVFSADSGKEGIDLLENVDIGVVMSDHMMPEMDGVTFLTLVKERKPDVVRLLLTGNSTRENAVAAINSSRVFEYLTKPWNLTDMKETLTRAFDHYNLVIENRRLNELTQKQNSKLKFINENLDGLVRERTEELKEAIQEGIIMLATAAEAKDEDTGDHVKRIGDMTRSICLELGMDKNKSEAIGFASIMHDVGKIHVPDSILKKPGPLNEDEWSIMKRHTIAGEKILGNKPFYKTAREIARNHHERWDGTGYPDGLKGKDIPVSARIVAIADVFDALAHKRSYKPAWAREKTIAEMKNMAGKTFDPEILKVFLYLIEKDE